MKFVWMMIGAVIVLQTGCAGNRTLDLPVKSGTGSTPATRGRVYIASVTDDRKFENKPSDPSTPSIAGDVTTSSAADKDQMIGRYRDTFAVMRDIKLPPGDSVTRKVRRLVEDGLARAGYQASADPNAPNSIAVSINQFWTWVSLGSLGLSLKFQAQIKCTVTVNNESGSAHVATIQGDGRNPGQVDREANWQDAFTPAFEDFVANFSREIGKIGLRPDSQPASQKAAAPDMYEELKRLDELRKSGIITEEEFEAQKKKILQRN